MSRCRSAPHRRAPTGPPGSAANRSRPAASSTRRNARYATARNSKGSGAPALKGSAFNLQRNGKTVKLLYDYVHDQMPLGRAGSLSAQEYADIVAYIVAVAGVEAGTERFTPQSPMDRVLTLAEGADTAASVISEPADIRIGALYGCASRRRTGRRRPSSTRPTPPPTRG